MWAALAALHEAGIAHRAITGQHIVERADGTPALADFTRAQLAASRHDLMIDRVHLLVTLSLRLGHDRAVESAVEALGVEGLAQALPYVQDPVLNPALRRAMGTEWDLNELRSRAIERTGAEAAPLVELRRVSLGSLVKLVLTVVIAASLIGLLAGVDFAAVAEELSTADLRLLLVGLLVAPLAQVFFSFSTLGSAMQRLPFLPVLMLQYAIQFIALVLPATAARVALQIRFFERLGIAYGPATTMGAIDGFGGFVVQVLLLLLIAVSSLPGFTTEVTGASDSGEEIQRPLPGGDGRPDRADLDGGDPGGSPAPRAHFGAPSPGSSRRCATRPRGPFLPERAAPPEQGRRGSSVGTSVVRWSRPSCWASAWPRSTSRPPCPS